MKQYQSVAQKILEKQIKITTASCPSIIPPLTVQTAHLRLDQLLIRSSLLFHFCYLMTSLEIYS